MAAVLKALRGELLYDEPLARYNSWRVGGAAQRLYVPADVADCAIFLKEYVAADPKYSCLPVYWLGLGSNVLIRDTYLPGTVIVTSPGLSQMIQLSEQELRVEAGVPCAKLAKFASRLGLTGAEFLIGIPGTMGGALAMNAGAFGGETWPIVTSVETLDRQGQQHHYPSSFFKTSYRHVEGLPANQWFIAATIKLKLGESDASLSAAKALLAKRSATQPIGLPSCGSVFRNPAGDHAARLIEACGLKGKTIGNTWVSPKHANFIVHQGKGKASEIEALIQEIEDTVLRQTGIELKREVKTLGEEQDYGLPD